MSEYEARQALQQVFDQFERRQDVRRGLLGTSGGTVMVPNRPGWAYIRYREDLSRLTHVRYLLQEQLPDETPVVVGKKHPADPFDQVLGVDWAMYAWSPSASTVAQYAAPVITLSELAPGKVIATDPVSMSVNVRGFLYLNGDAVVEFGSGTIDLTGDVPVAAGHLLSLVYVDLSADILASTTGALVAVGVDAEAPAVPEQGLPLAVVDLTNGDTEITDDDIYQYKILYDSVGNELPLASLGDYTRGYIIRGGAADWEAYDANDDGAALYGDGTDILSSVDPTWKGTHTWEVATASKEAIVIQTTDDDTTNNLLEAQDSGGTPGFQLEADFDVVIGSGAAGKDYSVTFNGQDNDGVLTWMEDEDRFQFDDDVLWPDNESALFGTGADMDIFYDGSDGNIRTDLVAASDLLIDCGTDKTIELQETVWDDFVVPSTTVRLAGANPADPVSYKDGIAISFDDAADEYAYFTVQLPHRYKEGTDIIFHVHWTIKTSGAGVGAENVKWDLTYSASSPAVPAESWPASSSGTATIDVQNDAADDHLIDTVATLTGTNFKISEVIICSLKRDTTVANNYGDEAYLVSADFHYEIDTMGSRQVLAK